MNKPREYRENAALCLEAMRAAEVPEVKQSLQSMAQHWTDLADRAERNSRRDWGGGTDQYETSHLVAHNPWQRF